MIGERLLDLRKEAGLTQDDLASILSVNKHSISSYERNKNEPPDEIKIKIANFFCVSVDYLVGTSDYSTPYKKLKNQIQIPMNLPPEAKEELKNFIDYLVFKYKKA